MENMTLTQPCHLYVTLGKGVYQINAMYVLSPFAFSE